MHNRLVGLNMWVEWGMNISWQGSFILSVVHRKNMEGVYNSYMKSSRHWNFSVFSFAQMIIKLNCWVVMVAHYSWCVEVLSAKDGSSLMKDHIIDKYPTLVISLVISIHSAFGHSPFCIFTHLLAFFFTSLGGMARGWTYCWPGLIFFYCVGLEDYP
jgi:hypothetical protein